MDWWKGVLKQSVHTSYDMINDLQARNALSFILYTWHWRWDTRWSDQEGWKLTVLLAKLCYRLFRAVEFSLKNLKHYCVKIRHSMKKNNHLIFIIKK